MEYDEFSRFPANMPYPGIGYAIEYLGLPLYAMLVLVASTVFEAMRGILAIRKDVTDSVLYYAAIFLPFLIGLQYKLRTASRLCYLLVIIYFTQAIVRRIVLRCPKGVLA